MENERMKGKMNEGKERGKKGEDENVNEGKLKR